MRLQPLESHSLKEMFVNEVIGQILSGELQTGERLPAERVISEKMGISRNVVRVGLAELTALGFLRVEPRRGTYVGDIRQDGNMMMLDAICRTPADLPTPLFRSLLEFRMTVLCESARLCALRRSDGQLARMAALLDEQAALNDSRSAEYTRIDFLYHKEIYIASGNYIYPMIHNSIKTLHQQMALEFYEALPDKAAVKRCHKDMWRAIRDRDPDTAARHTKEVLELGNQVMVRLAYLNER